MPKEPKYSLEKYKGEWNRNTASHLLRRTTFGPEPKFIAASLSRGLEGSISELFLEMKTPDPPINYYFNDEAEVPKGDTWVNAPYVVGKNLQGNRNRSLFSWTVGQMLNQGFSIREKMVLFWHSHFVISDISDPKFVYNYSTLLRKYATGNFKLLTRKVIINPAMLRYLNGNQNLDRAPNENFSRELLELFTIGKGDLAGPGDYTHYTEDDVVQIARALTGWRDRGYFTRNPEVQVDNQFRYNVHDKGEKQLSHRFDNAVITDKGSSEYIEVVNVIFSQDEVSRFICRKLYRWFVYSEITEGAEKGIIEPMAQIFRENKYEIAPVLKALLSSEHFYDENIIGCQIKNPYDFLLGMVNQFDMTHTMDDIYTKYLFWYSLTRPMEGMQMVYYSPPDVAGWKAYYQEPLMYKTWINSATLPLRMDLCDVFSVTGYNVTRKNRAMIDAFAMIAKIKNNLDPNEVVKELAFLLTPNGVTDIQLALLKDILIPGLPDFEWTLEYGKYLENPEDVSVKRSVENKIRALLQAMLKMPEFFLQ